MAETGFLFTVEEALKSKLAGMTVPSPTTEDEDETRPVMVRYWFPDTAPPDEIIEYPLATIQFLGLTYAAGRAHSGRVELAYLPDEDGFTDIDHPRMASSYPIPFDANYDIVVESRSPRHDRPLLREMLRRFPPVGAYLQVAADDTVRHLDYIGFARGDTIDAQKKTRHRQIWSVSVPVEIAPEDLYEITEVEEVVFIDPPTDLPFVPVAS